MTVTPAAPRALHPPGGSRVASSRYSVRSAYRGPAPWALAFPRAITTSPRQHRQRDDLPAARIKPSRQTRLFRVTRVHANAR